MIAALVATSYTLSRVVPGVSTPIWAFALSLLLGPAVRGAQVPGAGIDFSAKSLLRAGVALLGITVSLAELLSLGLPGMAIAAITVAVTLAGTTMAARLLRVDPDLGLLIGAGSAICGAAAVAAMETVINARKDHVGAAIVTVTLFGSVAMIVTPVVAVDLLHLDDTAGGVWIGASVHEVAQVAAAGTLFSAVALQVAVLTKLARVLLLAPVVGVVSAKHGGHRARVEIPAFIVCFLLLVVLRSAFAIPPSVVDAARTISVLLLSAGLAALGLQIRISSLRKFGPRPFVLGLTASFLAALTSLALVSVLL